jgi:hypothetical protein
MTRLEPTIQPSAAPTHASKLNYKQGGIDQLELMPGVWSHRAGPSSGGRWDASSTAGRQGSTRQVSGHLGENGYLSPDGVLASITALWPAVRTSAFSPFYSSLTNFAFPPSVLTISLSYLRTKKTSRIWRSFIIKNWNCKCVMSSGSDMFLLYS